MQGVLTCERFMILTLSNIPSSIPKFQRTLKKFDFLVIREETVTSRVRRGYSDENLNVIITYLSSIYHNGLF